MFQEPQMELKYAAITLKTVLIMFLEPQWL